jgi:hypothetical protein
MTTNFTLQTAAGLLLHGEHGTGLCERMNFGDLRSSYFVDSHRMRRGFAAAHACFYPTIPTVSISHMKSLRPGQSLIHPKSRPKRSRPRPLLCWLLVRLQDANAGNQVALLRVEQKYL